MTIKLKLDKNGQLVLPETILNELNWTDGTTLLATVDPAKRLVLEKVPAEEDWAANVAQIPAEHSDLDEQGHYSPEHAPEFHQWVKEHEKWD